MEEACEEEASLSFRDLQPTVSFLCNQRHTFIPQAAVSDHRYAAEGEETILFYRQKLRICVLLRPSEAYGSSLPPVTQAVLRREDTVLYTVLLPVEL